jgi:hypothetical protein
VAGSEHKLAAITVLHSSLLPMVNDAACGPPTCIPECSSDARRLQGGGFHTGHIRGTNDCERCSTLSRTELEPRHILTPLASRGIFTWRARY